MNWTQLENDPKTWKWVWLVSLLIFITSILNSIGDDGIGFGVLFPALLVFSLYGLSYEKPLWSRRFWKFIFIILTAFISLVLLLFLASYLIDPANIVKQNPDVEPTLFTSILQISMVSLFILEIRGLYLYAYKREHIWTQ